SPTASPSTEIWNLCVPNDVKLMLLSSTMTFTSCPAVACTEISGGFGMACWPSGRVSRTTTLCGPTSSPRIATRNMRGCCAGRPLTLMLRKIPSRLTLPSWPTRAWSQSADKRTSAVTARATPSSLRDDTHQPVGHHDDVRGLGAVQRRPDLRAGEGERSQRVPIEPWCDRDAVTHLPVDLHDERDLPRRREGRIEGRPGLTVHRAGTATPLPQLLRDVGSERGQQEYEGIDACFA